MGKPSAVRAGRQRQREVGDQQRFAYLRLPAHEQDSLRGQQSGFHQAGRRGGRLLLQQLGQRQDAGLGIFLACGGAHSSASRGGVQQNRFVHHGGFARGGHAQGGHGQFVHLARDAFGGLIQSLAGGVVEQRL